MITYYLTLSEKFPKGHRREGKETNFEEKVLLSVRYGNEIVYASSYRKVHTIRANYYFWKKRIEKIEAGKACLSIRKWIGKPYAKGSKQREIVRLTRENGIGIQCLEISEKRSSALIDGIDINRYWIAENDGLYYDDWKEWFKNYDLSMPMAIIHFTKFRY